jgi:hypothetical protein
MSSESNRPPEAPAAPDDDMTDPLAGDQLTSDRRQSAAAAAISRGVRRLLSGHGLTSVTELALPNGRRADVVGIDPKGVVWIVEVKSSIEDFRADSKWPDYREFCDHLLFAVAPDFPVEILPDDTGLIIADRFGGELIRPAPLHALNASRRRSFVLRLTRTAMARLHRIEDPDRTLEARLRE